MNIFGNNMGLTKEKLLTLIFVAISILFLSRLFGVISDQLNAPFDLVFETPNLGVIKFIQDGGNPYNPDTYSKAPFIFTVYTPLYHYIVASLPTLDKNPYFTGRVVSMIAMFLSAFTLFFVTDNNKQTIILPLLAFGLFFSIWPVLSNTAFLKNDPLALLFSASAIVIIYNHQSKLSIITASIFCILSILSKQSYISAFTTCFIYLLITNRRNFYIFLLSTLILSISFILMASIYWGNGFWFCTISALQQDITFQQIAFACKQMFKQPIYCFISGLTFLTLVPYRKKNIIHIFKESPYLLFVIISFFTLLLTIGKTGSSTNYFFEFTLSQLMWIIFVLGDKSLSFFFKPIPIIAITTLVICSISEVTITKKSNYSFINQGTILQKKKMYDRMKKTVSSFGIENPLILDIVDHRHLSSLTNKIAFNDPYHYKLIWQYGILDYHFFIESLNNQFFDIIMLPERRDLLNILKKPYDEIIDTIFKYYRIKTSDLGYHYLIRKNNYP